MSFDLGGLGTGPLTEAGVREWIRPLFSRVLAREEVYLANHSLGRPLDQMAADVAEGAWRIQNSAASLGARSLGTVNSLNN